MFKPQALYIVTNQLKFQIHSIALAKFNLKFISLQCDNLCIIHKKLWSSKAHDLNINSSTVDNVDYKSKIIANLNLKSETHAAPFYRLSPKTLQTIYKTTQNDKKNGYCENRLYYIATLLKCPPSLLSERLTRRSFIYTLSFEWIENSLKVLLEMGVPPDRILRDLWVLKYHNQTIAERLKRIKNLGIEKLYPWMVRCSEHILNRYIQIYQESKTILGSNKSTKVYLANRLDTTLKVIEEMYYKEPALQRIRPKKAKDFIDYLLEEGFSKDDIISKPRVLSASQKTIKERLDMMKSLGLKEINLNILCRSRKDFKRYYESLQSALKEQ